MSYKALYGPEGTKTAGNRRLPAILIHGLQQVRVCRQRRTCFVALLEMCLRIHFISQQAVYTSSTPTV